MADFPTIDAPDADVADYTELFDAGQVDNFVIGINRGVDGFTQALIEAKEFLGLEPEGTAEFETQEMKRDQEILRQANANDQKLTGAAGAEFLGEALPLFAVPLGGSVRAAAGLGGLSTSGFFQEDVNESRIDDIALGAVTGGLFKRLVSGGKAKQDADAALNAAEQKLLPAPGRKALPAPAQRQGQLQLTDQTQLALPAPARKASGPEASLTQRGFGADDFQNAGKNPIPGFQGVPKPRVRQELTAAQKAMASAKNAPQLIAKAQRKAAVFAANAKRKADKIAKQITKAEKAGAKPHIVAKLRNKGVAAMKDKVAAGAMAKAFQAMRMKNGAISRLAAQGQADQFTKASKPRVTVGSDGTKAKVAGPAAVAQEATQKPLTRKEAIKEILAANPAAKGLGKLKVKELREVAEQMRAAKSGGPGGKQGGFAESDLVNTLGGAALGGGAGLAVSDGNPLVGVAGAIGGGAAVRALGRNLDKVTTNKQRAGMRAADKAGGDYTEKVTRFTKAKDISGDAISSVLTDGGRTLDSFMGSTMTRLEGLSPRLATALANAEFQQHFRSGQWLEQGDKLFKRIADAGLTDVQQRAYKIHLLNSTDNAKRYLRSIGKEDAALAVEEFDGMLKDVGGYLGEVSLGDNLRKNYFPRMVTDTSQFEKIEEVQTYLAQLAKKKGIKLTDFEKETALTEVINGALTRGNEKTAFGRAAGSLQKRTNKVDGKNVDAYADPHEGFADYVESITTQVERRRFFQGQNVDVSDLGPNAENIETVASRLKDELKGGAMTADQVDEAAQLIRMRFGPGEQAPAKAVQNFKNLTYAGLLGNPLSAMTQFGDMALSAHRNGIRNTVASAIEQISGRGKVNGLDKQTLLGIRNAATDFASKTSTRDMLNWSLKYSGFQKMDELGKNTFINAAMKKAKQQSPDEFRTKWKGIFDPDAQPGGPTPRTDELMEKVRTFNKIDDTNREDVGFMLWNELSGAQPIALSSMPEQYLKNPNGRMAYMLQSFTLKMFDVMRKDIVQQARAGNHLQAAKNATKFTSLFVSLNGGVDSAKDFITGKEQNVPDTVMDNMLKMLGMNKFMVESASREGLGSTLLKTVAPPTALFDALGDPEKALKLAPIGGRVLGSDRFNGE